MKLHMVGVDIFVCTPVSELMLRMSQFMHERPAVVYGHKSNSNFTFILLRKYLLNKALLIGIQAKEKNCKYD
jgi:hypothetical protein